MLAIVDGEFTVKTLRLGKKRAWLQAENPAFPDLEINEDRESLIWGVPTVKLST